MWISPGAFPIEFFPKATIREIHSDLLYSINNKMTIPSKEEISDMETKSDTAIFDHINNIDLTPDKTDSPQQQDDYPASAGHGFSLILITLFVLLGAGILLILLAIIANYLLTSQENARNLICQARLKNQIGAVMQFYERLHGTFMPANLISDQKTSSWRTEIYFADSFDQQNALFQPPQMFICPDAFDSNSVHSDTSYMYVLGKECISDGSTAVKSSQITKGLSHTLGICEVINSQTAWNTTGDLPYSRFAEGINLTDNKLTAGAYHQFGGIKSLNIANCDGAVKKINAAISLEIWKNMPIIQIDKNTEKK